MNLIFKITMKSAFKRQYYGYTLTKPNDVLLSIDSNSYVVSTLNTCKTLLKEMFDCPDNEMTIDDAKKEYEPYTDSQLTYETLNKICEYYNIRRSLYIECVKELDNVNSVFENNNITSLLIHKDIPFEASHFDINIDANKEYPFNADNIDEYYIEIEVVNDKK